MTFLNPLILLGLIAAAIPILLHLLNMRKLRTVDFSSIAFLKQLQQTKIRRLKIRQIILLIIRTLIIVLIILAFARPTLRGTVGTLIGKQANSSIALIVDDSFSMSAANENGELFGQVKTITKEIFEMMKEGDEVIFVKLSDILNPNEVSFSNPQSLITYINELQISDIRQNMTEALQACSELMVQSRNANKEIFILSDLQRTLFQPSTLKQDDTKKSIFDENIKLFTIDISAQDIVNAAVDSIYIETKIIEKDKPVQIITTVRNYSDRSLANYIISIFLDDIRVAQQSINIEPWGSATIRMNVIPKRTGLLKGYVELEPDAIENDNRRFFVLDVPEQINVLLIAESSVDQKFVLMALEAASLKGEQILFNSQVISPEKFSSVNLDKIDVLVIMNEKLLSLNAIERIKHFIQDGGGLIFFPRSDTQKPDFNNEFLTALGLQQIERINTSDAQAPFTFSKVDFDHPLFATVFENAPQKIQKHIESPSITKTLKRGIRKHEHIIIGLDNGDPFLSEYMMGNGKMLIYSVAPVLSWSDFPYKAIFVPLIYRSIVYVSARGKALMSVIAGETTPIFLPLAGANLELSGTFNMVSPEGIEEIIAPVPNHSDGTGEDKNLMKIAGKILLRPKRFSQTGFYELRKGTTTLSIIAVNTDRQESDWRKISEEELEQFWNQLNISPTSVRNIKEIKNIADAVNEMRFGVELGMYCILLALLLAFVEMVVARDSRKELQNLS